MTEMNIIYNDYSIVVVNKPGGLLSVPGRGADKLDCVVSRIRELFPQCIAQPSVHRLDMDTSGLMVLALTAKAHKDLSMQFMNRTVRKQYSAILEGVVDKDHGEIRLPFRLDVNNRPHQIYDPVHGRLGITLFERQKVNGDKTGILFTPLTGRTHQLRLHSSHAMGLGCPIAGDRLYGNGKPGDRLFLHACFLGFSHPDNNEPLYFESTPWF